MSERIRLGLSQCLTGALVRYDGQHKYDPFLMETLGQYVDYVPVCPEVECGMPIPREALRLVGDPAAPRLVTRQTREDKTDQMLTWARRRVAELEQEDLCGFIFKSKSPSSGLERVKVYNEAGTAVAGRSPGLFARVFTEHFPLLPVEEEGRLQDPDLRENFIERIFALNRYRQVLRDGPTLAGLMKFHETHKLLIMAHRPAAVKELGHLLASTGRKAVTTVTAAYQAILLTALQVKATPARHVNVLQHMLGYFKDQLTADEKQEMLDLIAEYRQGLVPLIVPLTLLQHYVRKYAVTYLATQTYLHPHPLELKLRNHA